VVVPVNPASRYSRVVYENSILPITARAHRLDGMHWFANTVSLINPVPSVVTVHDLLYFESPEEFPLIKRTYLKSMTAHAVRHSRLLLPVSQYTADALKMRLKARDERMTVIPAVVDQRFQPVDDEKVKKFMEKYNLPDNFWLYVAHFYPHKNHRRLIEAYHGLIKQGFMPWPLVLRGDAREELAMIMQLTGDLDMKSKIIFLPRLAEDELPALYTAAGALVFPSLYEGGGIPVLEAMACGCPVAASNIPTTREFAGDAVLMFDPGKADSICEAMRDLQQDEERRSSLRERAFERVASHRADHIRRLLVDSYRRAFQGTA